MLSVRSFYPLRAQRGTIFLSIKFCKSKIHNPNTFSSSAHNLQKNVNVYCTEPGQKSKQLYTIKKISPPAVKVFQYHSTQRKWILAVIGHELVRGASQRCTFLATTLIITFLDWLVAAQSITLCCRAFIFWSGHRDYKHKCSSSLYAVVLGSIHTGIRI